ncbi:transposase, partial [Mediterraneibacter glycyrrhizinilyticus]|nr:transposase [Mediterraneibacter glycyrrhizinilyticus]
MGKADIAVKNWLSDKERFADLFNGTVFGGKQVVLPENLEDM